MAIRDEKQPVGRLIRCTKCRAEWDVIEASSPSLGPHEWVEPSEFVCPECATAKR